jgi:hypothetical protein
MPTRGRNPSLLPGSLGFEAQDFVLRTSTSVTDAFVVLSFLSGDHSGRPEPAANPPATATRYDEGRLR